MVRPAARMRAYSPICTRLPVTNKPESRYRPIASPSLLT
jgi:hypothetical protein